MSFDAFMFIKSSEDCKGETQDDHYSTIKPNSAWEVDSFEIGAENTINMGSKSGGAGAGKASFKELTVEKKTDTASPVLFEKLCDGTHFQEVHLELRRAAGAAAGGASGTVFLRFKFKLVMVQDISWSGSDGDDVCGETCIFQFGAFEIEYAKQKKTGEMDSPVTRRWSRIKNKNVFAV